MKPQELVVLLVKMPTTDSLLEDIKKTVRILRGVARETKLALDPPPAAPLTRREQTAYQCLTTNCAERTTKGCSSNCSEPTTNCPTTNCAKLTTD